MGQRQVQGAATKGGIYYLSSSAPSGSGGALYRVKAGKSATSTWNTGPELFAVGPRLVSGAVATRSQPIPDLPTASAGRGCRGRRKS
jgi:hypothetical protein